jgi:protein-disulfide isomerase
MNNRSKIAIGIASVTGILVIGFLALVGYYMWQLSFGSESQQVALQQSFGTNFSLDTNQNSHIGSLTHVDNPASRIHSHNPTFGAVDAPITIIAFIDFECPYCRRAYRDFEYIRNKYEPVVRVVFKHYPLESIHPQSKAAALAAQCAAAQDMFWQYYQAVFEGITLTDERLRTYASRVGVDMDQFDICLNDRNTERLVIADMSDGVEIGVRGTPTYIVNGIKYEGVIERETWDHIMFEQLQQ